MLDTLFTKLNNWMKSDDYKEKMKKEESKLKDLKFFLDKFDLEYISTMPIEEYASGRNNKESFCYMVEETFDCFGAISGRTTAFQKFVIYWSDEEKDYLFGDKRTKQRKGFGSNKEEIYTNVKKHIKEIIIASINNDYSLIANNPLNPQFKNKIAYLYNRESQLPIYSNDDLDVILTLFEIPYGSKEDRAFKREKLFNFYKENEINKIVTPYQFMAFIYSWYGYREYLRSSEKPTIENEVIKDYSLIDIQIDTVFETKRSGNGTKRRVVYNPGSEESKRITGRKAEDIVYEYLLKHKKDLNIKEITCWCFGEHKDDGRGYDISYVQNDGTEIYIEVKATKSDLKNQVYFEMSANEYSVMKTHRDTYYIYFVNDVNKGKIIRRILAKDIYGEEPIKYRVNFESKKKESEIVE